MKTLLRSLLGLLLTCPLLSTAGPTEISEEFQLKAAFIFNFSQFIDWPPTAFAQADSPLSICVVGADPFGDALLALQKRNYKNRPISVSYPKTLTDARQCRILYVDDLRHSVLGRDIGKTLGDAPVLTVSSHADAMEAGIAIGFVKQAGKVRWTLNLDAVRSAHLKVSAKLIEIAIAVQGDAGK